MSRSPEYNFLPKPLSMEERFNVAREFWAQAVSEKRISKSDFESQFDNPELTDDRLFAIAKELQAGVEETISADNI